MYWKTISFVDNALEQMNVKRGNEQAVSTLG